MAKAYNEVCPPYVPAVPLTPGHIPKGICVLFQTFAHRLHWCFIHNIEKLETDLMSINRLMVKNNVHTHKGILL